MRTLCDRFAATAGGGVIVALEAAKIEFVSKVSTWRKVGVVGRVAAQQAGRSRTFNAMKGAASATFRSFARTLHQLWLEVTGTVFLAMAFFGAFAMVREFEKYHAGRATFGRVAAAVCFTTAFGWFGVTSFWRVRGRGRRPQ
jgi:hypothetical protein